MKHVPPFSAVGLCRPPSSARRLHRRERRFRQPSRPGRARTRRPRPNPTSSRHPANVFANPSAVDPTASFRSLSLPAHPDFTIAADVPDTPVTVIRRRDDADSVAAPADLLLMTYRAAHFWTRHLDIADADGDTHNVLLIVGATCSSNPTFLACAGSGADGLFASPFRGAPHNFVTNAVLSNRFLEDSPGQVTAIGFSTLVHELGHTLRYTDPRGDTHADCSAGADQIMCGHRRVYPDSPITPTPADLAGIGLPAAPAPDHQDFGLWAEASGVDGLDRFGVVLTRTLSIAAPGKIDFHAPVADAITDAIAIDAYVDGTPSSGPHTAAGTATWSGIVLGAHTTRFDPVTGDATLTADLADLDTMGLALTALRRTGPDGTAHGLPGLDYTLEREGNTWSAPGGTATADFHADGADPAAAAAGLVHDPDRRLIGAWGGVRD